MKLSEIKSQLPNLGQLTFLLPDGTSVPAHFHITEVGQVQKKFIDCGGTVRDEKSINFQLWEDGDYDHRLGAKKLLDIIELSERVLGLEDLEVEVEYQGDTIGKYGLDFNGEAFVLTKKMTDCLAKDKCGIPAEKPKLRLSSMQTASAGCCTPNSGCC
ncbi:MAG: hypothetical protein KGZ90_15620 [Algoriphagus sp.]|nr:hypothetical protein [Algoriphagus sp.]